MGSVVVPVVVVLVWLLALTSVSRCSLATATTPFAPHHPKRGRRSDSRRESASPPHGVNNAREVEMSSTDISTESTRPTQKPPGVDLNLEVVTLPVADVDRAKSFYETLGWRLDIDLVISEDLRTVQFTPQHSGCSIQIGKGGTTGKPGSAQGLILVTSDIAAARADLLDRGVDVSEIREARPPGFEEAGRSYFARASFTDPDGNGWVLQEVTNRLPGREWED
jgi:catechol 2,3-dioxygenase-like lactoylglutathione lyase family enzyme